MGIKIKYNQMSRYNSNIKWLFPVLFFHLFIASCSKMSDYKKFVEGGEISYPGKIDSVVVFSGDGRVLIQGLFKSDPKVASCRIYWNNMHDSLEVPVTRTANTDTLRQFITLTENLYNFRIHTFDALGNKSVPVYATGRVYGNAYKESINNRLILRQMADDRDNVLIAWRDIDKTLGAFATEVRYGSTTGSQKTARFPISEKESTIPDYERGTPIEYRTLYRPDTLSIDTFYTAYSPLVGDFYFKKQTWTIVDFSSNHGGNDNKVQNVIDGTYTTRWHTLVGRRYPHFVVVDMQKKRNITNFSVERTTYDSPGGDSRAPTTFQLLVSEDNIVWRDLGVYKFNNLLNGEQFYPMSPAVIARYFKFIGLTGTDNNMVLGEISVYGY